MVRGPNVLDSGQSACFCLVCSVHWAPHFLDLASKKSIYAFIQGEGTGIANFCPFSTYWAPLRGTCARQSKKSSSFQRKNRAMRSALAEEGRLRRYGTSRRTGSRRALSVGHTYAITRDRLETGFSRTRVELESTNQPSNLRLL